MDERAKRAKSFYLWGKENHFHLCVCEYDRPNALIDFKGSTYNERILRYSHHTLQLRAF